MTREPKRRLPPAKSWREREVSDWNVTTFTSYLTARHAERYGIPYVPGRGGWRMEQGAIKRMVGEHGPEVVRKFIDACFREYRPTREYPALNFTFMYAYMRGRVLPKVLAEVACANGRVAVNDSMSEEEIAGWL